MARRSPFQSLRRVCLRLFRTLLVGPQDFVPAGPARILIVDDDEAICFSMKEYFGMYGFEVDSASDVRSAQRLIENGEYAAAVLDLRLRKEDDGFDLLLALRRLHPKTGVVILSVDYSLETRERAKRCGAHAFLGKPKPLSQVVQVVHALVESRSLTTANGRT